MAVLRRIPYNMFCLILDYQVYFNITHANHERLKMSAIDNWQAELALLEETDQMPNLLQQSHQSQQMGFAAPVESLLL